MENLTLVLFIAMMTPLAMVLFLFKDRVRTVFAFLMLGLVMCLLAGEINGLILRGTNRSAYYLTINILPIVEEVLKALPVLVYTFLYRPGEKDLLMCSVVIGIGFAILENAYVLATASGGATIFAAILRGFGSGMMHAICTLMVGYGLSYVENDKDLAVCGTFSLLAVAVMYHATYNCIVQSGVYFLGIALPIATFIPMAVILRNKNILK